jgi:hypothetical protein
MLIMIAWPELDGSGQRDFVEQLESVGHGGKID